MDLRQEVARMLYPVRVPANVMDIIVVKFDQLNKEFDAARDAIRAEATAETNPRRLLGELSPEDREVVARFEQAEKDYTLAKVEFHKRFTLLDRLGGEPFVLLPSNPERTKRLAAEHTQRFDDLTKQYRERCGKLIDVGKRLAAERLKKLKIAAPPELIQELEDL